MYGISSDFIYRLTSNILLFLDDITIQQKSLFKKKFMRFKFIFCSERMKEIQAIKITIMFSSYSFW